ncbi:MAG: hypothetical protein K2X87_18060 [Gemmataceae bacterium]|nr:hypothetical protein [Gemmataceae bacterium]
MDEIKMDAELAAKLNGKKVRLVDERGEVVGYYLPAADYAAGVAPSLPPQPLPTEEEIDEIFARPHDPAGCRTWEEIRADWLRKK